MRRKMEEVYTVKELASTMGVPWQTVAAWKRYKQIPSKAITPEGTFVKSIIDPYIEAYKNAPPPTVTKKPKRNYRRRSTKKAPAQQSSGKPKMTKNYSPEIREEAIRLMFEESYSPAQAAKKIGCVPECARQWKIKHQKSLDTTNSKPNKPSAAAKKVVKQKDFDDFAREYWAEGTRAVDVLLLPPEIGPKIVNYVNEALRYAYEKLGDSK